MHCHNIGTAAITGLLPEIQHRTHSGCLTCVFGRLLASQHSVFGNLQCMYMHQLKYRHVIRRNGKFGFRCKTGFQMFQKPFLSRLHRISMQPVCFQTSQTVFLALNQDIFSISSDFRLGRTFFHLFLGCFGCCCIGFNQLA